MVVSTPSAFPTPPMFRKMADKTATAWREEDSALFIAEGDVFVPERLLQIRTICDAIPVPAGEYKILELCCGEGLLSLALLERFPELQMHAFDGSELMLESTRKSCAAYSDRLTTHRFDIHEDIWRKTKWQADAIVSSLAIHHLDGSEKQRLYRDLIGMLKPGGVIVIADLMAPTRAEGQFLAAQMWDEIAEATAISKADPDAFERFQNENWNFYADPSPDPIDKPSGLHDQLNWLVAAGFADTDVHWLKAAHAIFSARKPD